jgi:hypothetical protein
VQAALFFDPYAACVTRPVAAALIVGAPLPDVRASACTVEFDEYGLALAVRVEAAVEASDPLDTARQVLVDGHLLPLVDALTAVTPLGRPALTAMIADALASTLLDAGGASEARRLAVELSVRCAPDLPGPPRFMTVRRADGPRTVHLPAIVLPGLPARGGRPLRPLSAPRRPDADAPPRRCDGGLTSPARRGATPRCRCPKDDGRRRGPQVPWSPRRVLAWRGIRTSTSARRATTGQDGRSVASAAPAVAAGGRVVGTHLGTAPGEPLGMLEDVDGLPFRTPPTIAAHAWTTPGPARGGGGRRLCCRGRSATPR